MESMINFFVAMVETGLGIIVIPLIAVPILFIVVMEYKSYIHGKNN